MQSVISILLETICLVGFQRDPNQDHGRKPHRYPEPLAKRDSHVPRHVTRWSTGVVARVQET